MSKRLISDQEILRLLQSTKSIAVVGISENPARDSCRVARYLRDSGFQILPVNPALETWEGIKAFSSVRECPEIPDLVDVFRRSDAVASVVDDAVAAGVKAIWLQLGIHNDAAMRRAMGQGISMVEDRCIMVEHGRLFAARP